MSKLDKERKNLSIILGSKQYPLPNRGNEWYRVRLNQYFTSLCDLYYYIIHDKDIDDDGNQKWLHIHCVIVIQKGTRKRMQTVLFELSSLLEIESVSIQIDATTNYIGAVQYLIHKNDSDKFQYLPTEIITSVSLDELDVVLSADVDEDSLMTSDKLINIVIEENGSRIKIMKRIGLGRYHLYRNTINDIIKEWFLL